MSNFRPYLASGLSFWEGGGEMGQLTREYDWSKSELGEPESWPQSLKTTLSIVLHTKFPMFLWWGPNLLCFYNDAYRPSLGNEGKHPSILGMPAREAWPEIWDFIYPLISQVMFGRESVYNEDLLLPIFRNGKMEDVYWTFSYSPVPDETGNVGGVLVTCNETTQKVKLMQHSETAMEQLRLSKEAAQLGMFDMDLVKDTLEWDQRCRALFGISHNNDVTYDHDFVNGLHPDDREQITTIISRLFDKSYLNGDYDVEYRTVGVDDGRIRWVRAKGKVYFDSQDKPLRFIGSVLDITEEKINEQRKNDFIAMVSHELKTPLTSVTAYIQLLLREIESGTGLESDLLNRANMQAQKMTRMINGFLNLSRLELGKLELQLTTFLLDDLIREAIADITIGMEDADLEFPACSSIRVTMDKEKIGAVITNFLSNAIKYSPKGKKVSIEMRVDDGSILVSVADQGMGIKANDVPYVFDRFYRVDNDNTRDIAGFGIGLYLSAEIVKLHQGKIWVESEYGKGSTFYFSIPF